MFPRLSLSLVASPSAGVTVQTLEAPSGLDEANAPGPFEGRESSLAVYNLGKRYGGRAVVQDVSLYVRRGEAVGLLGPNGAGKTTVFYMITGLVRPDKGVIELDGNDVTSLADVPARTPRHRLSAAGSLDFSRPQCRGQHSSGARSDRARPRGARGASSIRCSTNSTSRGCARRRRSRCRAASGGVAKSRARWPANRRSCCSTSLSPASTRSRSATSRISCAISRGAASACSITDHNVRETLGLIDRAYIIHSGHVLTEGSPDEIVAHPDVRRFYLGEDFRM